MLTLGTGLKAGKAGKAGGILGKMVPRRLHRNLRMVSERFSHDGAVRHNMGKAMRKHDGFVWYKWDAGSRSARWDSKNPRKSSSP